MKNAELSLWRIVENFERLVLDELDDVYWGALCHGASPRFYHHQVGVAQGNGSLQSCTIGDVSGRAWRYRECLWSACHLLGYPASPCPGCHRVVPMSML